MSDYDKFDDDAPDFAAIRFELLAIGCFPDAEISIFSRRGYRTFSLDWWDPEQDPEDENDWPTFNTPEFYSDTGERVGITERPCPGCGLIADGSDGWGGPDPCLGRIPDVDYACCGHGDTERAYLCHRESNLNLRGEEALAWFEQQSVGPTRLKGKRPRGKGEHARLPST